MSWNYRVTKRIHNHKYLHEPQTLYEIREVFYDDNGDIPHIDNHPHVTAHTLQELKSYLSEMLDSCDKPVIDYNTGEEI